MAILRGLRNQLRRDGKMTYGEVGVHEVMLTGQDEIDSFQADGFARVFCLGENRGDLKMQTPPFGPGCNEPLPQHSFGVFAPRHESERFVDDLTGLPLPPELCRAARRKEIEYFRSKGVWDMRSINEARRVMRRPPISVRWVETNKGDDQNPNIRSRLVAREIRTAGQDAIFAPTPPLESLRMILTMATTDFPGKRKHVRDPDSEDRTQVMLCLLYTSPSPRDS